MDSGRAQPVLGFPILHLDPPMRRFYRQRIVEQLMRLSPVFSPRHVFPQLATEIENYIFNISHSQVSYIHMVQRFLYFLRHEGGPFSAQFGDQAAADFAFTLLRQFHSFLGLPPVHRPYFRVSRPNNHVLTSSRILNDGVRPPQGPPPPPMPLLDGVRPDGPPSPPIVLLDRVRPQGPPSPTVPPSSPPPMPLLEGVRPAGPPSPPMSLLDEVRPQGPPSPPGPPSSPPPPGPPSPPPPHPPSGPPSQPGPLSPPPPPGPLPPLGLLGRLRSRL